MTPTVAHALRQRAWVIGTVMVISLLAALAFIRLVNPSYQAQANLLVDTSWEGATDPDAALRASDTLTQLYIAEATDPGFLQQVIDSNRSAMTPSELAKHLSVGSLHGTTMIAIRASAADPNEAAAIANAVAQALVSRNAREVQARFTATLASLDAELARLGGDIASLENQKVPANNAVAAADHSARLALLQNQYTTVYNQRQDQALSQTRGIATLSIADHATIPLKPVTPSPLMDLLSAVIVGLLLGILVALLVERLDDRLLNAQSAAEATGSPLVVTVPSSSIADRTRAYDLLHTAVRARHPESHLVMLAAASPNDHPDAIASELGAVAAHAGERVLVVRSEADRFGLPPSNGNGSNGSTLTTVALPSTADALKGLKLMTNGSGQFDFAVLSVPSPDRNAAALALANTARVGVLVTSAGNTHFREARRTADLLRQSGVDIAGTIFETRPVSWRSWRRASTPAAAVAVPAMEGPSIVS